jgi:hypothetical protein
MEQSSTQGPKGHTQSEASVQKISRCSGYLLLTLPEIAKLGIFLAPNIQPFPKQGHHFMDSHADLKGLIIVKTPLFIVQNDANY